MKEGVESLGRVRTQAMVLLAIAFLGGAFVGGTIERVMCPPARTREACAASRGEAGRAAGAEQRRRRAAHGRPEHCRVSTNRSACRPISTRRSRQFSRSAAHAWIRR